VGLCTESERDMIWQLHQQSKTDRDKSYVVAQFDSSKMETNEITKFLESCKKHEPLLPGHEWLLCDEKSKHFVQGIRK
jgi:hypothetical protein